MADPIYYNRAFNQNLTQVLSNSKEMISELRDDGYRISESCRFCLFIRQLSGLIANGFRLEDQKSDISLLAEGIRDFAELKAIVKSKIFIGSDQTNSLI